MGILLPKKGLKMPNLGWKQCLLGLGGQLKAPTPFQRALDSKQHVMQHMEARKWLFQPPLPKIAIFRPKIP